MSDKPIKDFITVESLNSSQHILCVEDETDGRGVKISLGDLAKSSISNQDNNLIQQGTDGKIYAKDKVGSLQELETEHKENIVYAINEVGQFSNDIGDLQDLETENKENIVSAINEVNTLIGNETYSRAQGDIELQEQIDAIISKTGVRDVVDNYQGLLDYNTSVLADGNIIKVLADETQDGAITYYKWITTPSGHFEYIGQEGNYYTKAQADSRFVPKTRIVNGKTLDEDVFLGLNDIANVEVQGSNNNDILVFDGSVWRNNTIEVGGEWGLIVGDIKDQLDLQDELNTKVSNNQLYECYPVIETYDSGSGSGYRIWSDGYCLQYGTVTPSGTAATTSSVTFLKRMANTYYTPISGYIASSSNMYGQCYNLTTTGMTIKTYGGVASRWQVRGYLAEGEYEV